jgi:NAD-dependent dihydropyrimidine dehydrogenase PreA subunit
VPGLFIDVKLDPEVAKDPELAARLAEVCPVNIFAADENGVKVVEAELDECVLCDLCLEAAPPGKLQIVKLYEQG